MWSAAVRATSNTYKRSFANFVKAVVILGVKYMGTARSICRMNELFVNSFSNSRSTLRRSVHSNARDVGHGAMMIKMTRLSIRNWLLVKIG